MCGYLPTSNLNTEEFPIILAGRCLSWTIANSASYSNRQSMLPTMTTSKSRKSVGPERFPKFSAYNVNFIQPRSGKPSGMSSSGSGWISTSGRIPLGTSVKQINRKSNVRFLATIPYRRLTYSGPNLSPHFIQMTFTTLVEILFVLILESYSGGHLSVTDKSVLCIDHLAIEEHVLLTVF